MSEIVEVSDIYEHIVKRIMIQVMAVAAVSMQ